MIEFEVRGEYITLDNLLKATGLAESGGRARMLISEGKVLVDGQTELRKTAKMRPGQVVQFEQTQLKIVAGLAP